MDCDFLCFTELKYGTPIYIREDCVISIRGDFYASKGGRNMKCMSVTYLIGEEIHDVKIRETNEQIEEILK